MVAFDWIFLEAILEKKLRSVTSLKDDLVKQEKRVRLSHKRTKNNERQTLYRVTTMSQVVRHAETF